MRTFFAVCTVVAMATLGSMHAQPSRAFSPPESSGGGRGGDDLPYWMAVLNAVKSGNLFEVRLILGRPPIGEEKPLASAGGILLVSMYKMFVLQNDPRSTTQAFAAIERALALGASMKANVQVKLGQGDFAVLTVLQYILENYSHTTAALWRDDVSLHERTFRFLDLAFSTGQLTYSDSVVLTSAAEPPSQWPRVNLLQWAVMKNLPRLTDYFVAKVPTSALDELGRNSAMTAALNGDLELLKKLRATWGRERAAAAFNIRAKGGFQPTALHMAVWSVANQPPRSAKEVIAVMDYLTRNGANPEQRSTHHNLFQEVEFASTQVPERAQEFEKLRAQLHQNLPQLIANYRNSLSSGSGDSDPTSCPDIH